MPTKPTRGTKPTRPEQATTRKRVPTAGSARKSDGSPAAAATPWGSASILEEAAIPQRAADRRFAVLVQLLEAPGGERLIRFAYATDGVARRGPVTMRARDLERLRAALERAPVLKEVLGM